MKSKIKEEISKKKPKTIMTMLHLKRSRERSGAVSGADSVAFIAVNSAKTVAETANSVRSQFKIACNVAAVMVTEAVVIVTAISIATSFDYIR